MIRSIGSPGNRIHLKLYFVQKKKGAGLNGESLNIFGGAERDRTVGLQSAILALSQLSYCPISYKKPVACPEITKNKIAKQSE